MISKSRLFLLLFLVLLLTLFWNNPWLVFFKVFVVFLHEISHAMGALLTGGSVREIYISWDESGFTASTGGNFLAINSAGYLGSLLWGSAMLHVSLNGRFAALVSALTGAVLLAATAIYMKNTGFVLFLFGLLWGAAFFLLPFFGQRPVRFALFFMGALTALYGVYDLGDFFRNDVMATDAGIIAAHYLPEAFAQRLLAYGIAFFFSSVSVWLTYRIIFAALHRFPGEFAEAENDEESYLPESGQPITSEMLAFLEEQKKHKRQS